MEGMTSCHGGNDMTPKTIAIGAALALAGVLLSMNLPIAEAQRGGPYELAAGGGGFDAGGYATYVWRLNQQTGEVSVCGVVAAKGIFLETTVDEAALRLLFTPMCSPWGARIPALQP